MLSAKELVKAVKEVRDDVGDILLENYGSKRVDLDSSITCRELTDKLDIMTRPLRNPRVNIKSSLSEAQWCNDKKQVIVIRNSGKQDSGLIQPEEALQLLENNALLLTREGVPLSLQAAYSLLLSPVTGVTVTDYLVYSNLAKAGFKVVRHTGIQKKQKFDTKRSD